MTQANAYLTSYDGARVEDTEDLEPIRQVQSQPSQQRSPVSHRRRLTSTLGPLTDEPFAVIKTRIRHRHGIASPPRPSPLTLARIAFVAHRQSTPLQIPLFPGEARAESSLALASSSKTGLPPSLLGPVKFRSRSPRSPRSPIKRITSTGERDYASEVTLLRQTNNYDGLLSIAESLTDPSATREQVLANHQIVLDSLVSVYRAGDAVSPAVRLLERLLDLEIIPYVKAYSRVITLLCWRDRDVHDSKSPLSLQDAGCNFRRALDIFDTASSAGVRFGRETVNRLLSGCVVNKDPKAASRLVKHAQENPQPHQRANAVSYTLLMRTHRAAGDLAIAKQIFEEMKNLVGKGDFGTVTAWNEMISVHFESGEPDRAIELLEAMLTHPSGPAPTKDTYTMVIRGFVKDGDLSVACSWFDRLLTAKSNSMPARPSTPVDAVEAMMEDVEGTQPVLPVSSLAPLPPSKEAWNALLDALYVHQDLQIYAKYYARLPDNEGSRLQLLDQLVILSQTALEQSTVQADEVFKLLVAAVRPKRIQYNLHGQITSRVQTLLELMAQHGRLGAGMHVLSKILSSGTFAGGSDYFNPDIAAPKLFASLLPALEQAAALGRQETELSVQSLLQLCHLGATCKVEALANESVSKALAEAVKREGTEKVKAELRGDSQALQFIAESETGVRTEFSEDYVFLTPEKQDLDAVVETSPETVVESVKTSPVDSIPASPAFSPQTPLSATPASSLGTTSAQGRFNSKATAVAEKLLESKDKVSLVKAHQSLLTSLNQGSYPSVDSLASALVHFGRNGLLSGARQLYSQSAPIFTLTSEPFVPWVQIEDAMMHASSLSEDISAANVHRARILEHGGVPSANSYAALVMASKSLTDEASVAIQLFEEARRLGARPHTFFYNVVISALSRARRAAEALTLMESMKLEGVPVTAVTYSAVIGACTRSGEEESAKYLFSELLATRGKLAAPVFNTMIQMYVQIKADRASALHYFDLMRNHHVKPTGFTYKVGVLRMSY